MMLDDWGKFFFFCCFFFFFSGSFLKVIIVKRELPNPEGERGRGVFYRDFKTLFRQSYRS